jgi:hypothetical protein
MEQQIKRDSRRKAREKGLRPFGHRSVTVRSLAGFSFAFNTTDRNPGWVGTMKTIQG